MSKKIKNTKFDAQTKCSHCVQSICCTYITHQIDKPRSMKEFDHLLWQVSHENVAVFKDEDGWYLSITGTCAHLLPNGNCGIYEQRPRICREHTNDYCEFDSPAEDDFDLYFDDFISLDEHCRKKFKNWDHRFKKWNKQEKKHRVQV